MIQRSFVAHDIPDAESRHPRNLRRPHIAVCKLNESDAYIEKNAKTPGDTVDRNMRWNDLQKEFHHVRMTAVILQRIDLRRSDYPTTKHSHHERQLYPTRRCRGPVSIAVMCVFPMFVIVY